MAVKTYAQQLEEVQSAIVKIEAGGAQSYGIAGRNLTRADLKTLYEREKWLRLQMARENNDGKILVQYGIPS